MRGSSDCYVELLTTSKQKVAPVNRSLTKQMTTSICRENKNTLDYLHCDLLLWVCRLDRLLAQA